VLAAPSQEKRTKQAASKDPSSSRVASAAVPAAPDGSIDPQLIVDDLVYTQTLQRLGLIPAEDGEMTGSLVLTDGSAEETDATVDPVQFGACCVSSSNGAQACVMTSEARCGELNGTFQGVGVSCRTNPCHLDIPNVGACC